MEQITTLGIGDNIISGIADHIEQECIKNEKPLDRLAFVFGGKRPALFLKRELAGRMNKSYLSPKFFSMDEFVEYLAQKTGDFTGLNEMESSYRLYEFSKTCAPYIAKHYSSFGRFYPWGKEIRAFLDHLDIEDVPDDKLKGVGKSAEIGYDVPKDVNELLKSVAGIRELYRAFMEKEKKYSQGYIYLKTARQIKDIDTGEFDHVYFCNLFYLHRTERDILKHLYNIKKGRFFFKGSEADWPQLKKLSEDFGFASKSFPKRPEPKIEIYSAQDTHAQCSVAREIIKKISDRDKAVFVVPDSESVMPALAELSSEVSNFNVSLGYPLSKTGVFSLLQDIKSAQNTRSDGKYYAKDYVRLLKNPLIKNLKLLGDPSVTRVLVHKIEEALTGENDSAKIAGSLFVSSADISGDKSIFEDLTLTLGAMGIPVETENLKSVYAELHDFGFKMWENLSNFGGFIKALKNLSEKLVSDSYFSAYQLNIKAMDRLLAIIEEFEASPFLNETFDREELFKIFEKRLASEMVSFAGSPLAGFQILGHLEVRSLNFDSVIIMDMNESRMPNLKVQEALIPRDIMLELGLTRVEKEEEIQRYHFTSLISGAKEAHLIYCDSDKFERSRFLERIIWEKQKKNNKLETASVFEPKFAFSVSAEKAAKAKTKEMAKYLADYPYSPTSINTYLSCPMKFYFQYALGLKEKEDVAEEVERRDIGIFVHEFLEKVLGPFVGSAYRPDDKFKAQFMSLLESEFSKEFERKMKADAFLLKEVVKVAMGKFFDNEVKRAPEIEKILGLEKNIKGTCFGRKFNIKIDRIDSLKDGTLLILDYKTGAISLSQSLKVLGKIGEKLSRETIKNAVRSLQLPIYMHFVGAEHKTDTVKLNAGLYDLKKGSIELFYKKEDAAEKKLKYDICMKALEFVLNEITDETEPFAADDSDSRQCSACPFYYACR